MNAHLNSADYKSFRDNLRYLLPNEQATEVGNLDGSLTIPDNATNWDPDEPFYEYATIEQTFENYDQNVALGRNELVNHLNWRYKPQSQGGLGCDKETAVIGGYSAGADLAGWAVNSGDLSQAAKDHIGYVALYGDAKFNRRCDRDRWWEMAPSTMPCTDPNGLNTGGVLGQREPYAPSWIVGRFGSWCDSRDGFCNGDRLLPWSHMEIYRTYWYWRSAHILASFAVKKRNALNPDKPVATVGAYTDTLSATGPQAPPPPPQTLTLIQAATVWPSSNTAVYQPLKFSYTVQNTSGAPASIARLQVAVRAPDGSAQDVPCANGEGVTLQVNQTFTCDARLPQGYGSQGTYTYWPDWMGYDNKWHHGQLGSDQSFTLGAPFTLSVAQPVSIGPSGNLAKFTPVTFSYRVRNTSGAAASIQRFSVAVRAPDGSNQDVQCANGTGVTIQANQEWTCNAQLPQGYGSSGTFTYWADWEGYDNQWHDTQLGWSNTFTEYQGPTLTTVGSLSVGPSSSLAMYQPIRFSYRIKNTSGAWASIQRFSVPVRGPGGVPLDVPCANGDGVTLAPNEEWTCDARLSTGYGSTGTYTFWADWLAYDGSWHQGNLSGNLTFTLGPPNTLSTTQYISVSPGNVVAPNSSVTFTYQAKNTSGVAASIQRFVVAVRGPNDEGLDVTCNGGNGVALAVNATFTCTAAVPSGYPTPGIYRYWVDWLDYSGVWHDGQLSDTTMTFLVN